LLCHKLQNAPALVIVIKEIHNIGIRREQIFYVQWKWSELRNASALDIVIKKIHN